MYDCSYCKVMVFMMLVAAIASGVTGTLCTRASQGLRRWGYALGAVSAYGIATVLLAQLVLHLPMGVVYAVWTGSAAVILLAIDTWVYEVSTTWFQRAGMLVTLLGVALLGTALS